MSRTSTIIDNGNDRVSVGEFIGFKDDIETYGKVVAIPTPGTLTVSVYDSNTGDRNERPVSAFSAWKE